MNIHDLGVKTTHIAHQFLQTVVKDIQTSLPYAFLHLLYYLSFLKSSIVDVLEIVHLMHLNKLEGFLSLGQTQQRSLQVTEVGLKTEVGIHWAMEGEDDPGLWVQRQTHSASQLQPHWAMLGSFHGSDACRSDSIREEIFWACYRL